MADVRAEIGGDEAVAIGSEGDGMHPDLFAGQLAPELDEPAPDLLQGEDGVGGWKNGDHLDTIICIEAMAGSSPGSFLPA